MARSPMTGFAHCPASRQQLKALATVIGVDADRLMQMLSPAGVGMRMEPIRLCAACDAESACLTPIIILCLAQLFHQIVLIVVKA
ncbi:hypothetical protein [Chlorogloeopsis sp. ULAP02]|uniref:hypothetical protein n=1 Tax=Chlorogloeopsis sp. ULAP02 TaxID=3107926 RepID=UPI003135EDF1